MRPLYARTHVVGGAPSGAIDGVHGVHAHRAGVLLELVDDRGGSSWGEASPLPGLSRETIADAHAALRALDPSTLTLAEASLAAVERALDAIPASLPSARFALETALLDRVARERETSVACLLGAAPDARRELCALLGGSGPLALAEAAAQAVRAGARTLKLKLDGRAPLAEAVARVSAVREAAPLPIALRLDANGTFDPQTAPSALAALAPWSSELFEEPVRGRALLALPGSPIPLAVDESFAAADDSLRSAFYDVTAVIVLKPTLLGGVLECRSVAREALARGVTAVVTHTLDGPLALAAAAALALALPAGLAHGLAPHPALAAYPSAHVDGLGGFELRVSAVLGLGVRGSFGATA